METLESKDINLLYTNWDGDTRLPNGSELGLNTKFQDFAGYITTHLNDVEYQSDNRRFNVNYVKLSEYRSDKTYFYAISHPDLSLEEILENVLPINDMVIELSKKHNNIYFIYSREHEGDNGNIGGMFRSRIISYNLDVSKFIVINNNLKIYDSLKETEILAHKSNFIPYSFSRVLRCVDSEFVPNKQGKFFMCRNRTPKYHRIALIVKLFMNKSIYDINYSFIPEIGSIRANLFSLIKYFDISFFKQNKELIDDINSSFKIDEYEINKNWVNLETRQFQSNQPKIIRIPELPESFENSYINIVTESMYEASKSSVHVTEKSLRPFFYYQFPIFLASPHHVLYLKDEYGFDLFEDILDHSYDHIFDDKLRMNAVASEIKRINDNKDIFIDFYIKNKNRFIKNREIFFQKACEFKQKDTDFLWNFL